MATNGSTLGGAGVANGGNGVSSSGVSRGSGGNHSGLTNQQLLAGLQANAQAPLFANAPNLIGGFTAGHVQPTHSVPGAGQPAGTASVGDLLGMNLPGGLQGRSGTGGQGDPTGMGTVGQGLTGNPGTSTGGATNQGSGQNPPPLSNGGAGAILSGLPRINVESFFDRLASEAGPVRDVFANRVRELIQNGEMDVTVAFLNSLQKTANQGSVAAGLRQQGGVTLVVEKWGYGGTFGSKNEQPMLGGFAPPPTFKLYSCLVFFNELSYFNE